MGERIRCLGMSSGGLDSLVSARLMVELGLDVELVHFIIPFHTSGPKGSEGRDARHAADQLGVPLHVIRVGEDFLDVIKHPRYGTGKGLNPCIDCRIFNLRKARAVADEIGARFVFTGEVLGQRPMSQHRRALDLVARSSGWEGLLLRPLSARRLPETIPEQEGWVDRERLLSISGRSRREQMRLAGQWGITEYPGPAGGCLLCDQGFARRLADLGHHRPDYTADDIEPLKIARHFRAPDGRRVLIGRNDHENQRLRGLALDGVYVRLADYPGPQVVVEGGDVDAAVQLGGDAAMSYARSAPDEGELALVVHEPGGDEQPRSFTPSARRFAVRDRLATWRL